MGMINLTSSGSTAKTEEFLRRAKSGEIYRAMNAYGARGVAALASATPVESGATAGAWSYKVVNRAGYHSIVWTNSNVQGPSSLAIMLQYGHGTGTGGYVQGRDFIMPAIRPVFDQIANELWKEVTRLWQALMIA